MIRNLFFLLILSCCSGHWMIADTLKKVKETPVSASVKNVLEQIGSTEIATVAKQLDRKSQVVSIIKSSQKHAKNLLAQGKVTISDVKDLEQIIERMKYLLSMSVAYKNLKPRINSVVQELSVSTMTAIESVDISGIDQDLMYIKDSLLKLQQNYIEGIVDQKLSLRIMAIISELLNRYDGVLISAYTVIVLSQVALTLFLLNVT